MFQKAKEEVKAAKWSDALKTFDALDQASQAPGAEAQRKQLEPVLAFYRGVCLANLDRTAEAQAQFETYLALNPNASVDRGMYSKKAVDAFEKARNDERAEGRAGGAVRGHARRGVPRLSDHRRRRGTAQGELDRGPRPRALDERRQARLERPLRPGVTIGVRDEVLGREGSEARDSRQRVPAGVRETGRLRRQVPRAGRSPRKPDGPRHGLPAPRSPDLRGEAPDQHGRGHRRFAGHVDGRAPSTPRSPRPMPGAIPPPGN